jgi:hypothetical protein
MKTMLIVLVGVCMGNRTLVLLAEPACVQSDYRAVSPVEIAEPNVAIGAVLGPVPGDPNVWTMPEGPFKPELAPVCDPDPNDRVVTVEYRGGSSAVNVDFDPGAQQWSFATRLPVGPCGYLFAAIDNRGGERLVWVWIVGEANNPPVLY